MDDGAWEVVLVKVKAVDGTLSLDDAGEAPSPRRRSDSIQQARRLAWIVSRGAVSSSFARSSSSLLSVSMAVRHPSGRSCVVGGFCCPLRVARSTAHAVRLRSSCSKHCLRVVIEEGNKGNSMRGIFW